MLFIITFVIQLQETTNKAAEFDSWWLGKKDTFETLFHSPPWILILAVMTSQLTTSICSCQTLCIPGLYKIQNIPINIVKLGLSSHLFGTLILFILRNDLFVSTFQHPPTQPRRVLNGSQLQAWHCWSQFCYSHAFIHCIYIYFYFQNIPVITCVWIGFFLTSFLIFIGKY